ncbi:MAG: hypothetical protein AAGE96_17215 [Cyanobacteria bacterium P01_G01_bin.19]
MEDQGFDLHQQVRLKKRVKCMEKGSVGDIIYLHEDKDLADVLFIGYGFVCLTVKNEDIELENS